MNLEAEARVWLSHPQTLYSPFQTRRLFCTRTNRPRGSLGTSARMAESETRCNPRLRPDAAVTPDGVRVRGGPKVSASPVTLIVKRTHAPLETSADGPGSAPGRNTFAPAFRNRERAPRRRARLPCTWSLTLCSHAGGLRFTSLPPQLPSLLQYQVTDFSDVSNQCLCHEAL